MNLRLVCAIAVALAVANAAMGTQAAAAPEVADSAIAAQPLEEALKAVERRTGLQIVYVTSLVEGKHSKGAPAGLIAIEALTHVLAGTGLTFKFLTEHSVIIQSPREVEATSTLTPALQGDSSHRQVQGGALGADETVLDTVEVTAPYISQTTGIKMDVPARDVPFSMTSYTDAFIKEIDAGTVADMYRYMTGINRAQKNGFGVTIRGFTTRATDRNGLMIDGMPGMVGRASSPPSVAIEQVEVFRGPSSVLYGRASPGGYVNIVPKKPQARVERRIELQGTAFHGSGVSLDDTAGYDVSVDFTGPIDAKERLLYRVISRYYDQDSYRDFSFDRNFYGAASLRWLASDKTTVDASFELLDQEYSRDDFLVAPNLDINLVAPITTRYQEPGDLDTERSKGLTLAMTHRFSDAATLSVKLRAAQTYEDTDGFGTIGIRPSGTIVQRRDIETTSERDFYFLDSNLNLKFSTGGLRHSVLTGVSAGRENTTLDQLQFVNSPAAPNPRSFDIGVYDPVYGTNPNNPPAPGTNRITDIDVYAVYVSDLITLTEQWKAVLGARYDHETDKFHEGRQPTPPDSEKKSGKATWMSGVVFQPNDTWSFYTSYSTSFRPPPSNVIDINGINSFDAETGDQIEAGTKVDFAGGRMGVTLAAYRITRQNGLAAGGTGPFGGYQVQTGEERSEGVELEVNALPLDTFSLTAGYAYADATVIHDLVPTRVGSRLTNAPQHSAHLWSRYDFPDASPFKGLGFGLGVVYAGDRAGTVPSETSTAVLTLPSFMTVDVAAYYSVNGYDFRLKLNNVFDTEHYTSAARETAVNPGEPRSVSLAVMKSF